jgi:hypothetical protein
MPLKATSFLPEEDHAWLETSGLSYEEVAEGNERGVVFHDFDLPANKYNVNRVDILVLVQNGYPDTKLDMFYCLPALALRSGNPINAVATAHHFGKTWQGWSRHYNWRSGIDGIESHVSMIDGWLQKEV